jgi:hypothetical protein
MKKGDQFTILALTNSKIQTFSKFKKQTLVSDEHTNECEFWTQSVISTWTSVISTRTSVIYTCRVRFLLEECDFYSQSVFSHAECDFYTQSVISTRSVMLKRTIVIILLTTEISTRTRVISTHRVWYWHIWVWLWHSRNWLWHSYVLKPHSACRNHSCVRWARTRV